MDANHQDTANNNLAAAEDVEWVSSKNSKLLIPRHNNPTGFENKTRWDKLQLLAQVVGAVAIPLSIIALIISVWQFNAQQNYDNQKTAEQNQTTLQTQKDQQQQSTLDTYLDRMSDLLAGNLNNPQAGVEVRALARARTLTALRILDPARKVTLLQFLHESNLIGNETYLIINGKTKITIVKSIINPVGADLSYVVPPPLFDLSGADLAGANLSHASLTNVNLDRADLLFANLYEANLRHATLSHVILENAILDKAILFNAFLENTDLSYTSLLDANLEDADLSHANLSQTDLSGVDLTAANLSDANLTGAIGLTQKQIAQAYTFQGATMPDGSTHP